MDPQGTSQVEVKAEILRAVLKSSISIVMKADLLLRDHYMNGVLLQDRDLDHLMDIRASTRALSAYLEDLIDQTIEAKVASVFLPPEEVKIMATLIGAVSVAHKAKIGNSNLWDH